MKHVYNDFLEDMVSEMAECVKIAREAGVADDKNHVRPRCVGFGKTYEMNLAAINHVDVLHRLVSQFYLELPENL